MDITFSEQQEMLRKSVADFVAKNYPEAKIREIEDSKAGYDPELWKGMADLGWQGLVIPEKYGGMGMTFQDLTVVLEEMGRNVTPSPFFCTVLEGVYPILDAGTEEQKQQFLPKVASGESILTMAILEGEGTYDPANITTTAVPKGNDFVINGTKMFVEQAINADYVICVTRTKKLANPENGITLFLVDAKAPGVKCEVIPTIALDKRCEMQLQDVVVPKKNMLGELDKGWPLVKKTMRRAGIAKSVESVGAMQATVSLTVDYLKNREQYDQVLASFQALQHIMADMYIMMTTAKFLAYEAAWMESEGIPCEKEAAMAKSYCARSYMETSRLMVRLYGGNGTNREFKPGHYYRRARMADYLYGDKDYQREIVCKEIGLAS